MSKSKLSDFKTQRKNSNRHTDRGLDMLNKAISDDGWITAITVCEDGEAIDGSARLETAYQKFGEGVEPIIVRSNGDRPIIHIRDDLPNADDPRAKKLSLWANRIASVDLAWDAEILAGIAEEVDISDMFFDDELAAIVDADSEEGDYDQSFVNDQRISTPKENEDKYLNSSVRQFILTYSIDEYDLIAGFFDLIVKQFNAANNSEALLALAGNYE